jgi:pyruvate,water dikinase
MAPMHEAGGRLFVDVTGRLASPATRDRLLEVMGRGDPLVGDALQTIVERADFLPSLPDQSPAGPPVGGAPTQIDTDPAIVTELIERNRVSIAALKRDIESKSGPALFDFLLQAFDEHKRVLGDPLSLQAIMAGMRATWWLNEQLEAWLGEKNAADTLTLSAPGNVTSEMGLELLDVADVIRPYPQVVAFLKQVDDEGCADEAFLDELAKVAGGREAQAAIRGYLEKYGMRCVGEIDITRPRWSAADPRQRQEVLARRGPATPRTGAPSRPRLRTGAAGAPARLGGWSKQGRRGQADDRPRPDLQRLPRVPQVRDRQPLLRLQAGAVSRSRTPRAGRRPS